MDKYAYEASVRRVLEKRANPMLEDITSGGSLNPNNSYGYTTPAPQEVTRPEPNQHVNQHVAATARGVTADPRRFIQDAIDNHPVIPLISGSWGRRALPAISHASRYFMDATKNIHQLWKTPLKGMAGGAALNGMGRVTDPINPTWKTKLNGIIPNGAQEDDATRMNNIRKAISKYPTPRTIYSR